MGDVDEADQLLRFTVRERRRHGLPRRLIECDNELVDPADDEALIDHGALDSEARLDDLLIAQLLTPLGVESAV